MVTGTRLDVKTRDADFVHLSSPEMPEAIPLEHFLAVVEYVLGNTNLKKDDPRLEFIERIRNSKVVEGYPEIVGGKTVEGNQRIAIGE
jgi:hypothetical protein